jgi:sterol desaturase/sphingolipid hydroxylase (fatty acid hydroxylase superfamily)
MGEIVDILMGWKAAVVLSWLAVFFLAERLHPLAQVPVKDVACGRMGRWGRVIRNLALWGLNAALAPLIVVPLTLAAAEQGLQWRPEWWSGWGALALDILLLDLWIYWWHRANHNIQLLWRFHEVHHLDQFLDSTSALRFHFGEVVLSSVVRAAVIVALGMPILSVIVFEILVLLAAIFHHSNLALPPRLEAALSRVVITPSIHWVHHHAIRADTDSNYGTIFSFWDPLFQSRSRTRRWVSMPIGVEGRRERGFLRLLVRPFRLR